jgi:hypothetical protein
MVELVVALMELLEMEQQVVDNIAVGIRLQVMVDLSLMVITEVSIMAAMEDTITGLVAEVDGMEAEVVDIMINQEVVDHHMLVV